MRKFLKGAAMVLFGLYCIGKMLPDYTTPTAVAAEEYKVGDVIEVDWDAGATKRDPLWPGALECYGREQDNDQVRSNLIRIIKTLSSGGYWPRENLNCQRMTGPWPHQIEDVADGVGPYSHIYRVDLSFDGKPTRKDQSVWIAFPAGHSYRSACKVSRAMTLAEIEALKRKPGYNDIDTGDHGPYALPCEREETKAKERLERAQR
jgi:hypothetical protein